MVATKMLPLILTALVTISLSLFEIAALSAQDRQFPLTSSALARAAQGHLCHEKNTPPPARLSSAVTVFLSRAWLPLPLLPACL